MKTVTSDIGTKLCDVADSSAGSNPCTSTGAEAWELGALLARRFMPAAAVAGAAIALVASTGWDTGDGVK
jgi:hypothetical protein